jgi:hypothetical protein
MGYWGHIELYKPNAWNLITNLMLDKWKFEVDHTDTLNVDPTALTYIPHVIS